jgi:hypothetical protein
LVTGNLLDFMLDFMVTSAAVEQRPHMIGATRVPRERSGGVDACGRDVRDTARSRRAMRTHHQ